MTQISMRKAFSNEAGRHLRGLCTSLINTTLEERILAAIIMALALLAMVVAAALIPERSKICPVENGCSGGSILP